MTSIREQQAENTYVVLIKGEQCHPLFPTLLRGDSWLLKKKENMEESVKGEHGGEWKGITWRRGKGRTWRRVERETMNESGTRREHCTQSHSNPHRIITMNSVMSQH
jgi:hypothetical protein